MEEKISRLTTIKTIGLTSLIIFGFITLWILFQFIGSILLENTTREMTGAGGWFDGTVKEMETAKRLFRAIYFTVLGLSLLTAVASVGVIKLKLWGLILYKSATMIIIVSLVGCLIYFIYSVKIQGDQRQNEYLHPIPMSGFETFNNYMTIGYGMFLLLFSWLLTRANIFLNNKNIRNEFR